jgi:ribosomal protein S24E
MELKDIHETKNLVFDRKEIQGTIMSESAPTNKEAEALLSKKLSIPEDAIKIRGIYGKFGTKEFHVKANVYKSKEDRNKIERKAKKEIETEKKEAESAKNAAEEEKKAEEKAKQEKTE